VDSSAAPAPELPPSPALDPPQTPGPAQPSAASTLAPAVPETLPPNTADARPGLRGQAGSAPPAVADRRTQPDAGRANPGLPEGPAAVAPVRPERAAPSGDEFAYLDDEPQVDGREAGERLAENYRSDQGRVTSSRSFGASGRFRPRDRSPRNLAPVERPAVATLRYLMTLEEAFHRKQGRYGSLAELQAEGLRLDVPVAAGGFQRKAHRFELRLSEDGYEVTALPLAPGPRPFIGDDSGIIRAGTE
jgi:hypothetical protein